MTHLAPLIINLLTEIETLFSTEAAKKRAALSTALPIVNGHLRRIYSRHSPLYHSKPDDQPALSRKVLPVCRYLPATLDTEEANAPLVVALRPLLPDLAWVQNPNYQAGNMPTGYLANYGYADIISARGFIADDQFALGILLLGPYTEYPPHHHPAEEIYYTIGGSAYWWQTNQAWTHRPPGSFVYHPSGVAHAMKTEGAPVCLLYTWWGDVQTAARLTKSEK